MKGILDRRGFLGLIGAAGAAHLAGCAAGPGSKEREGSSRTNVILCMSDDQGWGDAGFMGHPRLLTPHLDAMAARGVRFERWYAAAPVCSPTRGSCLTGRHPQRYGVLHANVGHMRTDEITLAEALKERGYATGHFGKWHLGTLTRSVKDSNRGGPAGTAHYSPPWANGFDVCFSTEAKVPTWDPMITPAGWRKPRPGTPFGTRYWTGPGRFAREGLAGDDSRIIMDRALPFIREAAHGERPFFAVIWFHSPHLPTVAGRKYRDMYKDLSLAEQHYYGCLTAMDEQVGRLRRELRDLGVADDTMLWFCSDNGPEGKRRSAKFPGSAGGLRGRKRSLHEGGIRVPGLLEWPAVIERPRVVTTPCYTSDYFPTILASLGRRSDPPTNPLDGIDLSPVIAGRQIRRSRPMAFEFGRQLALIGDRHKLYSPDRGKSFQLYDLIRDPGESRNIAGDNPDILAAMRAELERWRESCRKKDRAPRPQSRSRG